MHRGFQTLCTRSVMNTVSHIPLPPQTDLSIIVIRLFLSLLITARKQDSPLRNLCNRFIELRLKKSWLWSCKIGLRVRLSFNILVAHQSSKLYEISCGLSHQHSLVICRVHPTEEHGALPTLLKRWLLRIFLFQLLELPWLHVIWVFVLRLTVD